MRTWSWKRTSVASRVAISLILLSTLTLIVAHPLGLLPDKQQLQTREKIRLCETLAISCSVLAQRNDQRGITEILSAFAERNPDVLSVCVRRADGRVIEQFGEHGDYWHLTPGARSTRDNIYVPINTSQGQEWGTVELCFAKPRGLVDAMLQHPIVSLGLFTLLINGIVFRWFLGRVLTYLDPSKSVPTHVRSTIDTFAEGVVVLDNEQRIVLANEAFTEQVGKNTEELLGCAVDKLPWHYDESHGAAPWRTADASPSRTGMKMALRASEQTERTFLVNMSAITAEDGSKRGTIASFDDITLMEQKKKELSRMLIELQSSRDELSRRNRDLQYLATRDSLTGCVNRRTFFETLETQWNTSRRYQHALSCLMVDVDHFKSVNDNHGHGVGDQVLRRVAKAIRDTARDADVVCRYGGEEFCVLLPQTDTEQASRAAERIRQAIEQLAFENLSVTASLGVSSLALGAADPQEFIDEADKCLYVAKRSGRNRVVRWDEVPDDIEAEVGVDTKTKHGPVDASRDASIPYAAVASLLSALAYRDADTAAHSTRVAELSVATARGLMSVSDAYVLEIAALLHDIGKIGVPDAILLKPGPLTSKEWETMKLHDRIGVEMVEASFSNQKLVDVVRYHHACYGGSPDAPHMPRGKEIPLGARIVTIADAYDAIVSDRVYRKGRSKDEAFEELRRCAGGQFDPELVERFIGVARNFGATQLTIGSKQSALQIGQQIERLAQAVDDHDKDTIKALATRLEATASHCRVPEIEAVASEIRETVDDDGELVRLVEMVSELINLCSSTQKAYADVPRRSPIVVPGDGGQADLGERPVVQITSDAGVVLTQNKNEHRENQIFLTLNQREQAGRFLVELESGVTLDIERRLHHGGEHPDALLRIPSADDVNLTQLVGANRVVNVVFDTVEGMEQWAFKSDDTKPKATSQDLAKSVSC